MRVAVSGTHGLVGGHLAKALRGGGHDVVALVRSSAGPGEVTWDPDAGDLAGDALAGVDAVVHLGGAGIFGRWSAEHKRRVLDSRIKSTSLLASRLAEMSEPPAVFASGSAVGYYGNRGDEVLTEDSAPGRGFLSEVCTRWEQAAAPAADAGIRTVALRTGIVQAGDGGALRPQLPAFKLGLGARLGSGRQWVSWISIDDEVGAIIHALGTESISGPLNLSAPEPVTNAVFTRTLAKVLHRRDLLAVPAFALRAVLGEEMADEMLLGGQRVLPAALEADGYEFRHRNLEDALASMLGR